LASLTTGRWAKEKTANQDAFINGETSIMVASAFGMGSIKKMSGWSFTMTFRLTENYVQKRAEPEGTNVLKLIVLSCSMKKIFQSILSSSIKPNSQSRDPAGMESDQGHHKISIDCIKFCTGNHKTSGMG
jgi:hypothetical protein